MIKLEGSPKNRDFCIKLLKFFKEILDICNDLNILPILDGSLAVFAYTKNRNLVVNDIDLSVSETEFPKIVKALKEKGMDYRLREYHVLQVLKGDLKIELGSREYWMKGISTENCETLQIDEYKVKMLSMKSLTVKKFRYILDTDDTS